MINFEILNNIFMTDINSLKFKQGKLIFSLKHSLQLKIHIVVKHLRMHYNINIFK